MDNFTSTIKNELKIMYFKDVTNRQKIWQIK